jgi:lipopolysaccharide export system protein LptC
MSERGDMAEAPFSELAPLAPRVGTGLDRSGPLGARLWEQVLSYLPVLLMGLLAALTWWLVKNTPQPGDARGAQPPSKAPDYTMRDFAVSSYSPDGALLSRLEGDVLQHYPYSDTIEVQGVRLRALDEAGRVTLGRAQRAFSNGAATQVRLVGDAKVVREPGPGEAPSDRVEIHGEVLEVDTENQRVHSNEPVTLFTGDGQLRASSLDYDHTDRTARLGGRVTGVLRAAPQARP